ncbi:MAG: ribonuclease III [Pseudohongiellaceae bacterium]
MVKKLDKLQQTLAYQFSDPDLARLALTHRSASSPHNERLEFLGDSLLGFIIAQILFERHPQATEGELSRMRASLVSKPALAAVARKLGLGEFLQLGSGESASGGADRDSILADSVEALIAAIYLDGGIKPCKAFVTGMNGSKLSSGVAAAKRKDAKTRLQEILQAQGKALPEYSVVTISGAAHEQVFHVSCQLESMGINAEGSGASKRLAQQEAAKKILDSIEVTENQA